MMKGSYITLTFFFANKNNQNVIAKNNFEFHKNLYKRGLFL